MGLLQIVWKQVTMICLMLCRGVVVPGADSFCDCAMFRILGTFQKSI